MEHPILEVTNLKKHYPIYEGLFKKQVATREVVNGIDFPSLPAKRSRWSVNPAAAKPFCCVF